MSADICDVKSTLPKNASGGDEVCDKYGNKWVFDAESNGWISKGTISSSGIATEDNDGLITPDIFERFRKLETYTNLKQNINQLKLLPGDDAYWYYFRSSDKLFRFRKEGESALRIEVDKGRIFQILMKEICPGVRGEKGDRGDTGIDGTSGADEICYAPSELDNNRLDFAIFTPTPLLSDTAVPLPNGNIPDISVRIYKFVEEDIIPTAVDQLNHLAMYYYNDKIISSKFQATRELLLKRTIGDKSENLCNIPLSPVSIFPDDVLLDFFPLVTINVDPEDPSKISIESNIAIDEQRTLESIKFDLETGVVCGSVFLSGEKWIDVADFYCIKSRQMGPDGLSGDPGECRIKIIECYLDDTSVRATCPIVHARMDCEQETIFTLCSNLLKETCATQVRLVPDSDTLSNTNAFKSVFAAAEMTLDECKRINRYQISLEHDDIPELDLLHWDPQPGCVSQRHYDRHKFDWVPATDIPVCDERGTWYGPDDVRPGVYPFDLVTAPEPPEDECCQEDFFWCPNVQRAPCDSRRS